MGIGDVEQNKIFGEANIERKKHDPIYKIETRYKTKHCVYVGRVVVSSIHNQMLAIRGVEVADNTNVESDNVDDILKETQGEYIFPLSSFTKITRIK